MVVAVGIADVAPADVAPADGGRGERKSLGKEGETAWAGGCEARAPLTKAPLTAPLKAPLRAPSLLAVGGGRADVTAGALSEAGEKEAAASEEGAAAGAISSSALGVRASDVFDTSRSSTERVTLRWGLAPLGVDRVL